MCLRQLKTVMCLRQDPLGRVRQSWHYVLFGPNVSRHRDLDLSRTKLLVHSCSLLRESSFVWGKMFSRLNRMARGQVGVLEEWECDRMSNV